MEAAFRGDPLAQYAIAISYEQRDSFTNAVRWLKQAAEGGVADAQFKLGYYFTAGLGVAKDMTQAAKWYGEAAKRDHAEAQYNFAVCLEKGLGVPKDLAAAFQWHSRAAMLGDDFAQKALGVCHEKGLGVKGDLVEAWKWYHLAAERGNADAAKLRGLLQPRLSAAQLAEARKRYADFVAKAPVSVTAALPSKPGQPKPRSVDFLQ